MMCDGSMAIMKALSISFAEKSLTSLMNSQYRIATGKATEHDLGVPVLHRCLSHIMKNAKNV